HPGAVFRSPAWLLPWWNRFSVGRELFVLTARSGGRLVGVLPAYRVHGRLGLSTVRLLGDGIVGSDHLGVVAAFADQAACASAFAAFLVEHGECLALDGLDA